jgi:DNA-binding CsgD family transcriptional regulator
MAALKEEGPQPLPRILYLKDVELSAEESATLLETALELNWHRILIVANRPAKHQLERSFWVGPLDQNEAWAVIEGILLQKGITPQAIHRQAADKLGGHYISALAGGEAMAALPPVELRHRSESAEALLELSPRAAELDSLTGAALASLPPELQATARRMGFLGCPFRPATRENLLESMTSLPLTPIVEASLAVWDHGWLRPLPHLIFHVRRHKSVWAAEEEQAWTSFARWTLRFCEETTHANLIVSEVLSNSRETLAQAWADSTAWTKKAGFSNQDERLILLGAAGRCLAAKLVDPANQLLSQITENPKGHEGSIEIFRGWLKALEGRHEESIDHLHKGIEEAMSAGRNALAAAGLFRLGNAYFDLGRTVTSEFAYRQGAEHAANLGLSIYPALLSRQAFAVSYQGRHEEALAIQLKAVQEWEAFSDAPASQSLSRLGYARICYYGGRLEQAETDLTAILPDLIEQELLQDAAIACLFLALICVTSGRFSAGLSYGRQSEGFSERSGSGLIQTYALVQQTWCLMGLDRQEEANELIDRAATNILHAKHKVATAVILALFAAQAARRGEHQLALMVLGSAEACWDRSGRAPSTGEEKILERFLKPSFDNVPPAQARSLKQAGSLIPPEQIVSQLMIDRDQLLNPRVGRTSLPGLHQLSPRELEVFELLAEAKTNREMAELLGVTEGTVKRQVHSLSVKLKLDSRFQLIQAAKRMGPPTEEEPQTQTQRRPV